MPDRSEAKSSEESKSTGKGYPTRIVVKFDDELSLPYEAGAERALEGEMRKAWEQTAEKFPGITLQPLYDDEDTKNLSSLVERARENDPNYVPANFLTYFVIQMPAGFDGSSLAQMLSAMPSVETAYVEAGPVDPPRRRRLGRFVCRFGTWLDAQPRRPVGCEHFSHLRDEPGLVWTWDGRT